MKLHEIIEVMEKWAPLSLQEEWDSSGLQIGDRNDEIRGILVSMDCESEVVKYASENGLNLIINHHPLIFKPIPNLDFSTMLPRTIKEVIQSGINVYAAHTNLDSAPGGVNGVLAESLGYELPYILDDKGDGIGMGRFGSIESISASELSKNITESLGINFSILYQDPNKTIKSLAVVGGGGSFMIDRCVEYGIDALVTSDIKYHEYRYALDMGLTLIDIGHYNSEYPIVNRIADYLKTNLQSDIKIETYHIPDQRYVY